MRLWNNLCGFTADRNGKGKESGGKQCCRFCEMNAAIKVAVRDTGRHFARSLLHRNSVNRRTQLREQTADIVAVSEQRVRR